MYLAQQLLDQSVLILLQVKIRSEIQVNGGPCNQKTEDMKLSPRVGHGNTALAAKKALGPFGTLCTWSGWAQRETSLAGLFCQLGLAFGFPTYSGEKLSLESFLPLTLWEALHVPGFGAMRM